MSRFIDSIFGDDPYTDAFYQEDNDVIIEDGTYPAIIKSVIKNTVITRHNTHADIFKPTYEIAKGKNKGCSIADKGIWRFRSDPTKVNTSKRGNIIYKNILDIFDIPLEKVERNGVILKRLPELTNENIVGKNVLINVEADTYKSNYGKFANKVAVIHSKWENNAEKSK
tara:strand:+ start:1864 stop:2370 length:507 start_codon:yes stop_codon:yes gene_type:complete